MPFRRDDLNDRLAAKVPVKVLCDLHRHRHVPHAMYQVARHGHVAQQRSQVALEYGSGQAQRNVRSHVE